MQIEDAQRNMRHGYLNGGPGVLASSLVWLSAGVVALTRSPDMSIATLFIGGMFIHPLGILIAKALRRPGGHAPGNPLGVLAFEVTVPMLLALPLVYAVSRLNLGWFFPAMLFVIGGRYLSFATQYGMRVYWACGAVLALAGYGLYATGASFAAGAFTGGAIELLFAAFILATARTEAQ
jgi:hypothetical protein